MHYGVHRKGIALSEELVLQKICSVLGMCPRRLKVYVSVEEWVSRQISYEGLGERMKEQAN